jgi:hypothetical protein
MRMNKILSGLAAASLLAGAGHTARADYASTVLSFNPVAYWPLNETNQPPAPGNVAVNIGTGGSQDNGFYLGTFVPNTPGALTGDPDTSASFNGTSGHVLVPYDADVGVKGPFTAECWVNALSLPSAALVCPISAFHSASPRSGWLVYIDSGGGLSAGSPAGFVFRMYAQNGSSPSISLATGGGVNLSTWYHVAVSFDGTNAAIYTNGVLAASGTPSGFVPDPDSPLSVGSRSDSSFFFTGSVDEVALYPSALTPSVIQSHYQNGINPTPTPTYPTLVGAKNPLIYLRLDETPSNSPPSSVVATNYGSVGATINGTYLPGTVPGAPGPFGSNSLSCKFVPVSGGYVDCTGDSSLDITGPMTVLAWFKGAPADSRFQSFVGKADSSWRGDVDGTGFAHFADNGPDATGVTFINDGNWHYFAGVFDGTSNLLYIDGVLDAQVAATLPIPGSTVNAVIGAAGDYVTSPPNRLFQGSVAQVAVYTNALTKSQIGQIQTSAGAPPQVSLKANAFSGDENGSATIAANPPVGSAPIALQWWVIAGGVTNALAGQTNLSLTLNNLQTSQNTNQYFIVAANLFGAGASATATLTVLSGPPVISPDLPTAIYAVYGGPLVLSIGATGTLPMTNQWYLGSTALSDGPRISGSHSNVLTIIDLQPSDLGNYQVVVTNSHGNTASQTAQLASLLPFLNFNGSLGWDLNGGAVFSATDPATNTIEMTDGNGSEARSAWFQSPMDVTAFRASWVYQTGGGADGTTFCVQDSPAGTTALGNGGGALGFGGPDGATSPGITPSVALAINIYNGHTQGIHVYTNGIGANASGGVGYDSTAPVSVANGDFIQFVVTYMSGVMNVALTDLTTPATFSTNYLVNIPGLLGSSRGFVGLTAGTGGVASTQVVSNFTYVGIAALSLKVSGPNLVISWPFVSGQYVLQQNSAVNGAHPWSTVGAAVTPVSGQNQVTIPLPSSPAYYRLQLQ